MTPAFLEISDLSASLSTGVNIFQENALCDVKSAKDRFPEKPL